MRIEQVELLSLEPFKQATVEFPVSPERGRLAEVHLFTGPNGTGKSRLLAVLAASTSEQKISHPSFEDILKVSFSNQPGRRLVTVANPKPLARVHIVRDQNAKAASFAFGANSRLTSSKIAVMQGTELPSSSDRLSFQPWSPQGLNQRIANLKVQAAMELMNSRSDSSGRWLSLVRGLENSISNLGGRPFSVIASAHPEPALKFKWGNVILPITGLPVGLNSIVAWVFAAATYADLAFPESANPLEEPMLFFLDEVEAFLHPQWQRKLIPMAQELFPNSQLFVATHSPFVVSSLNSGYIYKLEPQGDLVTVSKPVPASKGDSYISALTDVLGVKEWFDVESEELLKNFRRLRDAALEGDVIARTQVRELGESIAARGPELADVIGMELRQFERSVATPHRSR